MLTDNYLYIILLHTYTLTFDDVITGTIKLHALPDIYMYSLSAQKTKYTLTASIEIKRGSGNQVFWLAKFDLKKSVRLLGQTSFDR